MNNNTIVTGTIPENHSPINTAICSQNIRQSALDHAESGFPVFPCDSDSKRPLTHRGFKDASTEYEVVEKWWLKHPNALIGMPTGNASGVFVLDIDVKHDVNGFDSLATLEKQYGALPVTLTVKTPSGGEHRYFIMPETDPPLSNSAGKLGAGLDTRGEGGYVIIPPSVNSESKSYQFVDQEIEPAELPQWLIDLLKKTKDEVVQRIPLSNPLSDSSPYGHAALKGIVAEMIDTPEGQRNDTLNRLAFRVGVLVRDGEIDKYDIRALYDAALSTGLSVEEVRRTFKSGFDSGLEAIDTVPTTKNNLKNKTETKEVIVQCAADMPMTPIEWIWPGWLPKGKLTLLAGKGGTGKTTLALLIASTITTGGEFPDGSICENGDVLIWSGEDVPEDTLIPRLKVSGANLEKCYFIQGTNVGGKYLPFDPATDIPKLEEVVKQIGRVSLLIIDPIVSAISGDMNRANEVRRSLQSLIDFGAKNNCTVLGITHFRKGSKGASTQERVIGSQAFGALARMVLSAAQEEGKERRVLARAKSNIAPDHGGFEYTLQQGTISTGDGSIDVTYAVWGNPIEGTADEILESVEGEKQVSALDDAKSFLRDILCDGEMLQQEIESAARSEGISLASLKRAKKELHIKSRKTGMKEPWLWELPDIEEE